MSITSQQYEALLRKPGVAKRNPVGSEAEGAEPQCPIRHEPVAEKERETSNPSRFLVRIESLRSRLIDPDNLCPKYFIDCLRYAEIIPGDRARDIELSVSQIKVAKGFEMTLITVTELK